MRKFAVAPGGLPRTVEMRPKVFIKFWLADGDRVLRVLDTPTLEIEPSPFNLAGLEEQVALGFLVELPT